MYGGGTGPKLYYTDFALPGLFCIGRIIWLVAEPRRCDTTQAFVPPVRAYEGIPGAMSPGNGFRDCYLLIYSVRYRLSGPTW